MFLDSSFGFMASIFWWRGVLNICSGISIETVECKYKLTYIVPYLLTYFSIRVLAALLREYCQFETFAPHCYDDEVLVMTSAHVGRMRVGRCMESDLGYASCSKDVLEATDRRCSGRQNCTIKIPDPDLDSGVRPCDNLLEGQLKTYLEASYACHRGMVTSHLVMS